MVRKELLRLGYYPEEIEGGGLRVTTTFTEKAMDAAVQGVGEARPDGFGDKQLHIGVATVEPGTGAVRGIFGGQDFLDSQINWAVAGGQAGSTMKPAALVAAIEDGFSLKDTFDGNSPIELPDGTEIENQGDADYGSAISMVMATENSVNTAFIDMTMSMEDGPEKVVDAANRLGIPPAKAAKKAPGFPNTSPGLEPITGVALGNATVSPINMANAYATLANDGRAAEPYIIEKVVLANGETDYQHKVANSRAVEPDINSDVSYALQEDVEEGLRHRGARPRLARGRQDRHRDQRPRRGVLGVVRRLHPTAEHGGHVRPRQGQRAAAGLAPVVLRRRLPGGDLDRRHAAGDGRAAGRGVPRAGQRRRGRSGGRPRAVHAAAVTHQDPDQDPDTGADDRGAHGGADDRGAHGDAHGDAVRPGLSGAQPELRDGGPDAHR